MLSLIYNMNSKNVIGTLAILKNKYGITYTKMGSIMGVPLSALRVSMSNGNFEGIINPEKMENGIEKLKNFYLYM